MKRLFHRLPATVLGLLFLAVTGAQAQSFTYRPIDFPNAIRTRAWGINPGGNIVGDYRDSSGNLHGFLLTGGRFATIDVPGTVIGVAGTLPTSLRGINPGGETVGYYLAPAGSSADCTTASSVACIKGFIHSHGVFSSVLFPGHPGSIPQRITPDGNIYGCYHDFDLMASMFGFVRTRTGHMGFDVPASMHTGATPEGSTIVGLYTDMTTGLSHGYVVQDGNFEPFDAPGSIFTQAWDINPAGNIVGVFRDGTGNLHGFLRIADAYTQIDYPGAVATQALGINPAGAIVGLYTDTSGMTHGFLAVPAAAD